MKRILILDDNLTICLMLKSWLVKQHYQADTATSVSLRFDPFRYQDARSRWLFFPVVD